MKKIISILLAAYSVGMMASVLEQTISLNEGWNAVYLEVTPEESKTADVFENTSVIRIGCYSQYSYSSTIQYTKDGTPINGMPAVFLSWDRDCQEAATLNTVIGGEVYLMYATSACTFKVVGTPVLPKLIWRDTSKEDAMMNLVGVSIDEGVEVTPRNYFGDGPYTQGGSSYTVFGTALETPYFLKMGTKGTLKSGSAVGVSGKQDGEWSGVFKVVLPQVNKLAFKDGILKNFMMIENTSSTNLKIRITHRKSDSNAQTLPVLNYLKSGATILDGTSWESFAEGDYVEKEIAPKEVWQIYFSADRSQMTDTEAEYASLLRIEAIDSPSKMRVFVPVTVEQEVIEEGNGAYPQGLWVGVMDLQQVNRSDADNKMTSEPEKAGGRIKATLILHVDENNKISMHQRIAVAAEDAGDGVVTHHLYQELGDVPEGLLARRISSMLIDTAFPKLEGLTLDGKESKFGDTAYFEFTVDENSKVNPYRHAWHPDHDGLSASYMDKLPSGDNLDNYKSHIKPELFSITNKISLHWQDIDGKSTHEWIPEETSYGRIDWKIDGLRSSGEIFVRGTFIIKRVSAINVIK